MRKKLAVLGAGNMGLAITDGILSSGTFAPSDITLVRRSTEKLAAYKEAGLSVTDDLFSAAKGADVLLLALKPVAIPELLRLVAPVAKGKLVVSIAAGIKTETIEKALPESFVVRAMPNTPLTVGEGVTEICAGISATEDDMAVAKSLFAGSGSVVECKEEEINAFTALTSSAVAYFARIESAMCRWAKSAGLDSYSDEELCELVSKTAMGTAKLLSEKKLSPDSLVKAVASPNGTTERALNVFDERDLEGMFEEAMSACLRRAEELSSDK